MDLRFRSPFEKGVTARQGNTTPCGTITVIESDPDPPDNGNGDENGVGEETTMTAAAALLALVIAFIVLR